MPVGIATGPRGKACTGFNVPWLARFVLLRFVGWFYRPWVRLKLAVKGSQTCKTVNRHAKGETASH